jgi:hypothetical protein
VTDEFKIIRGKSKNKIFYLFKTIAPAADGKPLILSKKDSHTVLFKTGHPTANERAIIRDRKILNASKNFPGQPEVRTRHTSRT